MATGRLEARYLASDYGYIDTADVAKLIRRDLREEFPKEAWPGLRFSVRIKRYVGGSRVDITLPELTQWSSHERVQQGPDIVRSIVCRVCDIGDKWKGRGFDAAIDQSYSMPVIDEHGDKYITGCYVFVRAANGCTVTQRTWPYAMGHATATMSSEDARDLIMRYGVWR